MEAHPTGTGPTGADPTGAGRRKRKQTLLILLLVMGGLTLAGIACAGDAINMAITGQPEYICPSATPVPTNTMPPPSPPYYPPGFLANLDYWWVDPNRGYVDVQYVAQNVGWVFLSYQGTDTYGNYWSGSNGSIFLTYAGNGPAISGSYPIFIPSYLSSVSIFVSAGSYSYPMSVSVYPYPIYGGNWN